MELQGFRLTIQNKVRGEMILELQEIVEQIHFLISKDWSKFEQEEVIIMREELDNLTIKLMTEIDKVNDIDCLEKVIQYENEHFFLPIPCAIKLYQRVIFLSKTNISHFEGFVDYLLQYGPDWEEEANILKDLYTNCKFEDAIEYAQKIEYYKDFRN